MMDVRKMTFEDVQLAFEYLSERLDKPETITFDVEDGRWFSFWRSDAWSLELMTSQVGIDGSYTTKPTLFISFCPDRVKKPRLRYDAALIVQPSDQPAESAICHRPLAQLLLTLVRIHGPTGARLADHLTVEGKPPTLTSESKPEVVTTLADRRFVKIEHTGLARWLCRVGLHALVKTDGGGMGDAGQCLVCGQDKYPEVFRGWALASIELDTVWPCDGAVTGRFTDALNKSNIPKECGQVPTPAAMRRGFDKLLESLPAQSRTVLLMCKDGKTYEEIGALLKISAREARQLTESSISDLLSVMVSTKEAQS